MKPLAVEATRGAWYRCWRLVSLDGSRLDVADEKENEWAFGRPSASRGRSAYPQIRFVSLVENGTHVLFGTRMADYTTGEITLAEEVIASLQKGMLCLADRNFFGFTLWNRARATGAALPLAARGIPGSPRRRLDAEAFSDSAQVARLLLGRGWPAAA